MNQTSPRSFVVGLLGQGVGPSLTPELHEREGLRQGFRYVYKTVDLRDDQTDDRYLRDLLAFAADLGFDGLNVTHPVKQTVAPLLHHLSDDAAAIGAVNTVTNIDGVLTGHNTDVTGFRTAFRDRLSDADLGSVLVLGAGGAGTAVVHALAGLGADSVCIADPDGARLKQLEASVRDTFPDLDLSPLTPAETPERLARATGVVNATPVGMSAHPGAPVDPRLLDGRHWVVDIVYRPLRTRLLTEAADRGCRVLSGAGMAVHQAADAFELITGSPADRAAMTADFDELVATEAGAAGTPTPSTETPTTAAPRPGHHRREEQ